MSEFCSKSFLFSLLTLFIALYVNLDISGFLKIDEEFQSIKELVLAWDNIIPKNKNDFTFKKIAVGVNGDVDLILKGSELLMELNPLSNRSDNLAKDHSVLANFKDLDEIFTFYLSRGSGGERFLSNLEYFKKIIEATDKLSYVKKYVGGNAALIAHKLYELNNKGEILVGLPVGPVLEQLIEPTFKRINSATTKLSMDEYHVVLEYKKDEKWNGKVAPASSRFIFSHDISNMNMSCFEDFVFSLSTFQPDLVVISGLHMLEGGPWKKRLDQVSAAFDLIPKSVPVHVELASMASTEFIQSIVNKILPKVHSIGLNEQELWSICHSIGGTEQCQKSLQPNIPITYKLASDMIKSLTSHLSQHHSKLSRIHFHSLPFHVIATTASSAWGDQLASLSAGSRQAILQACGNEDLLSVDADIGLVTVNNKQIIKPVIEIKDGISFHITPTLVCRKPLQTVGLGDGISASGLLYSKYL